MRIKAWRNCQAKLPICRSCKMIACAYNPSPASRDAPVVRFRTTAQGGLLMWVPRGNFLWSHVVGPHMEDVSSTHAFSQIQMQGSCFAGSLFYYFSIAFAAAAIHWSMLTVHPAYKSASFATICPLSFFVVSMPATSFDVLPTT